MKKCHDFLKNPPESVCVLSFLVTFCLIALDSVCLFLWQNFTFAYVIYALSAIFLAFSVFLFVKAYPKIKQKFVGKSDPAAFNMVFGICVCVAIFALGAFILANGQKKISYIKKQNFLKSEAAKDEKFQNESDTQKGDVK